VIEAVGGFILLHSDILNLSLLAKTLTKDVVQSVDRHVSLSTAVINEQTLLLVLNTVKLHHRGRRWLHINVMSQVIALWSLPPVPLSRQFEAVQCAVEYKMWSRPEYPGLP